MANVIGLAKAEVADALTAAGVRAFSFIPERIQPPAAVIAAGTPFLEGGTKRTFTDTQVRLDITVIAGQATNVTSTDELEALICTAILALGNWDLESVSQPFQLEANNAYYLAARMTVSAFIEIKEVI